MTFPRRAEPKIQPTRMRRRDAEDIADELITEVLLRREKYALFITPSGEVRMCGVRHIRFQDWCERWPSSLCGIYDDDVQRQHLIDDIIGMER